MTSVPTPSRAVVFDADGVLQGRRPGFVRGLIRLGGPRFALDCLRAEATTITGTPDLVATLDAVARRHRVATTGEELMRRWLDIVVDPEALALVAELRAAGTVVALGTNQQPYRGRWMQQQLGYPALFDASFYSFELGVAKPEPGFFLAVIDGLGLPPAAITFVDDLPGNVRAARRVGMRAVWQPPWADARALRRALTKPGGTPH